MMKICNGCNRNEQRQSDGDRTCGGTAIEQPLHVVDGGISVGAILVVALAGLSPRVRGNRHLLWQRVFIR